MSFPKYPEYKDSGVEWFGDVPCDWRVQRLKQVVNPSRPITYGIVQAGENVPDGIPYIRPADMADESGVKTEDALLRTSQEIASAYRRSSISAGDIVCSIGPSFGKLMMVPLSLEGANLTQGTARVAVANEHVPRFIFWILRSVESYQQWESSVGGATFRALNLGPLAETFLCVPSWAEQTQIARFLDHETARIDVLIEEQQRLIELLKEKRQAVISHAVTKGLDPTAPMKDSGVEWLGEVPAHWTVAPVKFFFEFLDGQRIPIKAEDRGAMQGDYPYYGASGIIDYVNDFIFEEDLVLVSEDGANLLMRSTPIAFVARGKYWVNNHAHIIRPQDENLTYWAEVIEQQDLTNYVTGSAQPKLTAEALGSIKIAVPPTGSERAAIQAFILKRDADLGALLSEAASGVRLLQERRSALISAAVTGKIDVRSWQPPASTQAPELAVAEAN